MGRTILLTGRPGVGKTTVIRKVVARLGERCGGFYTAEMRQRGRRVGFRIVTLDGREGVLAHVDIRGRPRVGRYGVNLRDLDEIGVAALRDALTTREVVVVDEIGKMELFSPAFKEVVLAAIEGPKAVLGTIMLKPHPWADRIKSLPRVTVLEVTRANRDTLPKRVVKLLDEGGISVLGQRH